MFYVYILESETTGHLYIGQTDSPEKRLTDHNRGASPYTRNKGPWKRIFLKEFSVRSEALTLEKKLKFWKNPQRIKVWIVKQSGAVG